MGHEKGEIVETIVDYWGQSITLKENMPVNTVNEEAYGLSPTEQLKILAQSLQYQLNGNGDTGRLIDFLIET